MSMSHGGGHTTSVGRNVDERRPRHDQHPPEWLAVSGRLCSSSIIVVHARHMRETHGQRRIWHAGHVLMAFGMVFMFAPASIDHFNIPAGSGSSLFANAADRVVAVDARPGAQRPGGQRAVAGDGDRPRGDGLHVVAERFSGPITWLLVAYFALQALLWLTNRYARRRPQDVFGAGFSVTPTARSRCRPRSPGLRPRPAGVDVAMTLGMAYMFAAMQLLSSRAGAGRCMPRPRLT